MSQSLADQLATTALSGGNAGFIEDLYEQFLRDPTGVDPTWAAYFKRLQGGAGAEIAAQIHEAAFDSLDAPVARVAALDSPMPYNKHLEHASLPSAGDIVKAAEQLT